MFVIIIKVAERSVYQVTLVCINLILCNWKANTTVVKSVNSSARHYVCFQIKWRISSFLKIQKREMFYLTMHLTHFIYGYMADIWLRTILIVRKETCRRHMGYSYRLTARVLLYAASHRQDNTYHGFCYTSRGALAGTRNSSMGPPHEGSIRRPIALRANALPLSYVPLPKIQKQWNLWICVASKQKSSAYTLSTVFW